MFMLQNFKSLAEKDESGVRILSTDAGFCFKRQLEAGAKERCRRLGCAKELNVSGQAGVVGEKVAESDLTRRAAWFAAHNKAGEQIAEWLLQIEMALLVEEHRECGGHDDLGEAGNIVDSVGLDWGGVGLIGEAAKAAYR